MNHNQESAKALIKERWREFWNDHRDFDPPLVRNVLHGLSEILPLVFTYTAVREVFPVMYAESGVTIQPAFDAMSADEDLPVDEIAKLPIFRNYLALRAYAFYGLKLPTTEDEELGMESFLDLVQLKIFPQWWLRDEDFQRARMAFFARRKLDFPESGEGLSPDELAALARVTRKSVMNLLAPSAKDALRTKADSTITVESAGLWLSRRSDFKASVWHLQGETLIEHKPHPPLIDGEPVFVPVAGGGVWFSPEHALDGRFHVASAEQEEVYDDYWAALDFLSRASSPRWRYRDEIGRWYMKPASGWERKTKQEIERLLEQTENQPKPNKEGKR